MAQMRLDKFLTECSGNTRSEVKKWLKSGNVTVNGMAASRPEMKIDPEGDAVLLQGKLLSYQPFVALMFHKPAGCVTATEDRFQKTVMDYINHPRKKDLFPVGRLDIDTEGLLFLINDGALSHRMLSPRHHVPKTYEAQIAGKVTEEDIAAFKEGLDIGEKRKTLPAQLEILEVNIETAPVSRIRLTICEGKFHQVKRMFEARGKKVTYLKRVCMAGVALDEALEPGSWRELTQEETERLKESC